LQGYERRSMLRQQTFACSPPDAGNHGRSVGVLAGDAWPPCFTPHSGISSLVGPWTALAAAVLVARGTRLLPIPHSGHGWYDQELGATLKSYTTGRAFCGSGVGVAVGSVQMGALYLIASLWRCTDARSVWCASSTPAASREHRDSRRPWPSAGSRGMSPGSATTLIIARSPSWRPT